MRCMYSTAVQTFTCQKLPFFQAYHEKYIIYIYIYSILSDKNRMLKIIFTYYIHSKNI